MATLSMGSSYCIPSESMQCKAAQDVYSIANNVEASRIKGSCVSFASLTCNQRNTLQNLRSDGIRSGRKRGQQVIVAASPPTEDAVIATEPLTKEDLVAYLASGCKPKENWRFNFKLLLVLDIYCTACI